MSIVSRLNAGSAAAAAALVLVATQVLLPTSADARPSGSDKSATLSEARVIHDFAVSGVKMFNPLPGAIAVASLTASNPQGAYNIGATLYPTARYASSVFSGAQAGWLRSGFDVALRGNVIVTVVPKGAVLGRKARTRIPMPAAVAKSLALLKADLAR